MRPSWPLPSTPSAAPGRDDAPGPDPREPLTAAVPGGPSASARRGTRAASRAARDASSTGSTRPAGRRWSRPALPIASVATGTPPGIWTIDSSESSPCSAALCTGTPSTGSTVCAATMPGRCAAPPAPAMITSMPRASAPRRELRHPDRRAMRRHDVPLVGHVEALEHLDGVLHRLPVGRRAHDDGDEWSGGIGHRESSDAPFGSRRRAATANIANARAPIRATLAPRSVNWQDLNVTREPRLEGHSPMSGEP